MHQPQTVTARRLYRPVIESILVVIVIALIVAGNDLVWTNVVGLSLVLHLVVLVVATFRGFGAGSVAAVAAAAGLALLLDPAGSLRISEPANWVALASFLLSAAIASRLVSTAREQAHNARTREDELARLYELSIDLFSSTARHNVLERATRLGLETLEARSGCLLELRTGEDEVIVGQVSPLPDELLSIARCAAARQETVVTGSGDLRTICVSRKTPDGLRVLIAAGTGASRGAVESVAALVSLAAEQERFLASATHLEALVESDRLKTGILRAVSHDLATPLATITLQIEALERVLEDSPVVLGRVSSLRQDIGMLRRRIENLLAMARIESGVYRPHPEPLPAADLFRLTRHHLSIVAPSRSIEITIAADTPDLFVDPSLALEILGNLVDNAHRASPEGARLELEARGEGSEVVIEVLDRGSGLRGKGNMSEGDVTPSGLGLEIARSLAAASRSVLELESRTGGGTTARLRVPAFMEEIARETEDIDPARG